MSLAKLIKAWQIVRMPRLASTMIRHRVAGAIEHLDALRFLAPASVLDVGANKGQFAAVVRALFPDAIIHSFEPLPGARARFEAVFAGDTRTILHPFAIGTETKTATFYVADRDDSSSLFELGTGQTEAFGVHLTDTTQVQVRPLEELVALDDLPRPVLLKIDVQGGELEVLQGIENYDAIDAIYVECSYVALYEGQGLFEDVRAFLAGKGFYMTGLFNQAMTDRFGPTQADFLFMRSRES